MKDLVKGVALRRSTEAISTVQMGKTTLQLVSSWDGTEVIRQIVPEGARFGLRPDDGWDALECLYVLDGTARWERGETTVTLRPGDSLTGSPVMEPCILQAETDLVALYICSQPVFHSVTQELQRLEELAVAVAEKDGYTRDHCARIQSFAVKVGKLLGLNPVEQHYLLYGSFLHDLGKLHVPDNILKKRGKLSPDEWHVMKQHTLFGRDMLHDTFLKGAAPILEQHHERLDGSGYPYGLRGDEIHIGARIVAVVDSYDAMTTDRVYQKGRSPEAAIEELQRCSGHLYEPEIVQAFIHVHQDTFNAAVKGVNRS